jgi:hypothetical protein
MVHFCGDLIRHGSIASFKRVFYGFSRSSACGSIYPCPGCAANDIAGKVIGD